MKALGMRELSNVFGFFLINNFHYTHPELDLFGLSIINMFEWNGGNR